MDPRLETAKEKKLVVISRKMSVAENLTFLLWNSFMKRKSEILNAVSPELYSIQTYEKGYFENFNPRNTFTKMAGIEVSSFEMIPDGMEAYVLEGGKYAVFQYKGHPKDGGTFFQHIFQKWLPSSGYVIDDRAHFEVLGEKYNNSSSGSEEEIWIPVKLICQ
ncbi:MAG TPA: GyrI-like domain-containing protein [Flavobacterium sp.]|nr:GyrI-like domain-containing protein [Flavobacterium sp.]